MSLQVSGVSRVQSSNITSFKGKNIKRAITTAKNSSSQPIYKVVQNAMNYIGLGIMVLGFLGSMAYGIAANIVNIRQKHLQEESMKAATEKVMSSTDYKDAAEMINY